MLPGFDVVNIVGSTLLWSIPQLAGAVDIETGTGWLKMLSQ